MCRDTTSQSLHTLGRKILERVVLTLLLCLLHSFPTCRSVYCPGHPQVSSLFVSSSVLFTLNLGPPSHTHQMCRLSFSFPESLSFVHSIRDSPLYVRTRLHTPLKSDDLLLWPFHPPHPTRRFPDGTHDPTR